jgi:hypothetical protein
MKSLGPKQSSYRLSTEIYTELQTIYRDHHRPQGLSAARIPPPQALGHTETERQENLQQFLKLELGCFSTRKNFQSICVDICWWDNFAYRKLLNFCEIEVTWEANHISLLSCLTQSLILNEWPSENDFGDENGPRWDTKITNLKYFTSMP